MNTLTPAPEPMLYSRRQVAAMLGLCEKSVWQLSRDGKLPIVRLGRAVRHDAADVRRLIESAKGKGGGT